MSTRGYQKAAIRAFPQALRSTIELLRELDSRHATVLRHLHGPVGTLPRHSSPECCVYPALGGSLVVGSVVPDWRFLRFPTKNAEISDLLSSFFHFCEQFIARGRALRITAAGAIVFHRAYDFRFGDFARVLVSPSTPWNAGVQIAAFQHDPGQRGRRVSPGRREREFAAWVNILNTLDPMIHRAAFQYWRAVSLSEHGYWEEATTALDGMTGIAAEAVQRWLKLPSAPSRGTVGRHLGLTENDQAQLQCLYELRCDFGAHPSPAKWWDFAELYESELDENFDVSRRLLNRLCQTEKAFRTVDPSPSSWSQWFQDNAHSLIDAVWFTRIR